MATVKILTGLNGTEEAATIPRAQWRDLVSTRQTHCKIQFRLDCRALIFFIEDAAKNGWLGYGTREKYIRDGLGLDPAMAQWAVDGLRRLDGKDAVPFDEAVVLGQHGQYGRGRPKNRGSALTSKRGANISYIRARLHRDKRNDLVERLDRGELSANAAAIQAGFLSPRIKISLEVELAARAIKKHFSRKDIVALVRLLEN